MLALKPTVTRATLRGSASSFAGGNALAARVSALSLAPPAAAARGAPLRCEGEEREGGGGGEAEGKTRCRRRGRRAPPNEKHTPTLRAPLSRIALPLAPHAHA